MVWQTDLLAIQVTGDDVQTFLQGQLSNDVLQLTALHEAQLTAYCLPNGRTLAVFRLVRLDDGYLLVCPNDVAQTVVPRLRMFVLRSDVTFTELASPVVAATDGVQAAIRWSIRGIEEGVSDQASASPNLALGTNDADYMTACIERGLPYVGADASQQHIPQMLNLDLLDGINFKKGCYPGQEIVARMKYLGKLKRRTVHYTTSSTVQVNDEVLDDAGAKVGVVLQASPQSVGKVPAGEASAGWALLAVVQVDQADAPLVCNGAPLRLVQQFHLAT